MTSRKIIQRRARIFLGCEGESEQGYAGFLQRLADEYGLHVHISAHNLQPAGDPLALAEMAVKIYAKEERKGGFVGKVILLDADRLDDSPGRRKSALDLLVQDRFLTIWQRPDHEGLLLRHFQGHDRDDPPRGRSMSALVAVWPGYRKNMSASELKKMLSITHVQRAAAVTPELQKLMVLVGLG